MRPAHVFTGDGGQPGHRADDFAAMDAHLPLCQPVWLSLCWEFPHFGRWAGQPLPEQPGSPGQNPAVNQDGGRCCSLVGQQCQDSAVEVGCSAVRLVQGAVDSADMVLVGAAPGDGLFPVVSLVELVGGFCSN